MVLLGTAPSVQPEVVLRYRIHLEQRGYAPATINLQLAAVRRVAYEAADAVLLNTWDAHNACAAR